MIDLNLGQRRSSDRRRSTVTRWVGRLEALESRVVFNGAVGVPRSSARRFTSSRSPRFPEDANNDGVVTTQSVTVVRLAERPGLATSPTRT